MKYGIQHDPPHPGKILGNFNLEYLGGKEQVADDIGISVLSLNEILKGNIPVNANTALKLAGYFKNTPQFWLNLQMNYDLYHEMKKGDSSI
jgi:addiction module HigA family antidote